MLDQIIAVLGFLAVVLVWILKWTSSNKKRRPRPRHTNRQPTKRPPDTCLPQNPIVVDGSNVLHWGGDPSADVLSRVMRSLQQKGYSPIIFFDANVGYVLDDRYYDEARLAELIGIQEDHICVVSKGVIADESILSFATDYGLRVVTNDRYRDWRVTFPHAAKKGVLIDGKWQDGSVIWRRPL